MFGVDIIGAIAAKTIMNRIRPIPIKLSGLFLIL